MWQQIRPAAVVGRKRCVCGNLAARTRSKGNPALVRALGKARPG